MPGEGCGGGSYVEPWRYRACIRASGSPANCSDDPNSHHRRDKAERTACLTSTASEQPSCHHCLSGDQPYVGNLAPMPGVFPDYPAPVVRNTDTERELTMMRWGMPPPPRTGGPPVTNIRNTSSPQWRGWLKPETDAWSRPKASPRHAGAKPRDAFRQGDRAVLNSVIAL